MNEEQKPEELLKQEALVQPVDCEQAETEIPVPTVAEETDEAAGMSTEELNATIEQLCLSKAQEFRMLGYDHVTGLDIWNCVSSKYKELPPMHKLVNDILSLRSTKFMNWLMIKAQTE